MTIKFGENFANAIVRNFVVIPEVPKKREAKGQGKKNIYRAMLR